MNELSEEETVKQLLGEGVLLMMYGGHATNKTELMAPFKELPAVITDHAIDLASQAKYACRYKVAKVNNSIFPDSEMFLHMFIYFKELRHMQ